MALTITQANAVNHVIAHLTHGAFTREQAINDLAELASGASKALHAGYSDERARAALGELWPDLTAETWTDSETCAEYDLTVGYHDANGDAWTCVGWLTPFDSAPVPYMECRGMAVDIETVVREFGPLTVDAEDGA